MGVLECHQLIPPNNMVQLKTHKLCVKNQVEFMVQLEWVDVEFAGFFFLPNLHPLTLMVKSSDLRVWTWNPVHRESEVWQNLDLRVRTWNPVHRESEVRQNLDLCIRTWTPVHRESEVWQILDLRVRTWNPVHRDSQDWQKLDLRVRTWNPVHGGSHSKKTQISVSGHETRSTGQIDVLLFLTRVRYTQNHPIFTRNWMYRIWM